MPLSRRQLLPLLSAGLLTPRLLPAAPPSGRRFLFIFCEGGWDAGMVFSPVIGVSGIDSETGLTLSEAGGIPFGDHEDRPEVRSYFENHGDRTCVISGLEVRSIVHDKCDRLILTGQTGTADDWGAQLAGSAAEDYLLPYLHISGPMYTRNHTASVVRLGSSGQLPDLVTGSALADSDIAVSPLSLPPDPAEAFLSRRAAMLSQAADGQAARWLEQFGDATDRLTALRVALEGGAELNLEAGTEFVEQLDLAVEALRTGVCRCTMVQNRGLLNLGWDTHSLNDLQSPYFATLFSQLEILIENLSATPGLSGGSLLDEVCVVVFSEMGRHPIINHQGGRDHWTYTSAMLIGSGVAGGQSIGGLDDGYIGHPIDLTTGESTDQGTLLQAGHFGATLLALGDLDPSEPLPGFEPITAAMV
ncbi:MAG: hypothetical protein ACI8RZ_006546 [Myxococcota bacterium]|jgi:hypothetical protein